jgi:hypothetical protein
MKEQFFDKHTIAPEVGPELFEYPADLSYHDTPLSSFLKPDNNDHCPFWLMSQKAWIDV